MLADKVAGAAIVKLGVSIFLCWVDKKGCGFLHPTRLYITISDMQAINSEKIEKSLISHFKKDKDRVTHAVNPMVRGVGEEKQAVNSRRAAERSVSSMRRLPRWAAQRAASSTTCVMSDSGR